MIIIKYSWSYFMLLNFNKTKSFSWNAENQKTEGEVQIKTSLFEMKLYKEPMTNDDVFKNVFFFLAAEKLSRNLDRNIKWVICISYIINSANTNHSFS